MTHYDYGFRIYNPGIARFLSVDPLTKSYPWYTPYQFAGNNPIKFIDLDGLEEAEKNFTSNVVIFIGTSKEVEDINKQATDINYWNIISDRDISAAYRQFNSKFGDQSIENLVIRTHGYVNRGSVIYDDKRKNTYETTTIKKYGYKSDTDNELAEGFMSDLKSLVGKVKAGGNVVFVACLSGKDEEFVKTSFEFLDNKDVNIYHNTTLSNFKARTKNTRKHVLRFGGTISVYPKGWVSMSNEGFLPSLNIISIESEGNVSTELVEPSYRVMKSKSITINDSSEKPLEVK